jgi:hypothetical protein
MRVEVEIIPRETKGEFLGLNFLYGSLKESPECYSLYAPSSI